MMLKFLLQGLTKHGILIVPAVTKNDACIV